LDDLITQQQAAYALEGVDENVSAKYFITTLLLGTDTLQVPAAPVLKRENKKRKTVDYTSATPVGEVTSTKHRKTENTERKSKNTAVYVTGLPPDTEQEEIVERFSKCGVIEEDERENPRSSYMPRKMDLSVETRLWFSSRRIRWYWRSIYSMKLS
jgi:HIV Tat-specific factor 1